MKSFLLKNADGSVQVMHLVQQKDGLYSSPEVEIAKWTSQKRAEVQSWREVKLEHLPKDRTFRNAWCDVTPTPTVDIDMPKARNIQRERLRALREPKLVALDVEMSRAFNDPAQQKSIEARRQALRDVTKDPAIERAETPEALAAVVPEALRA